MRPFMAQYRYIHFNCASKKENNTNPSGVRNSLGSRIYKPFLVMISADLQVFVSATLTGIQHRY